MKIWIKLKYKLFRKMYFKALRNECYKNDFDDPEELYKELIEKDEAIISECEQQGLTISETIKLLEKSFCDEKEALSNAVNNKDSAYVIIINSNSFWVAAGAINAAITTKELKNATLLSFKEAYSMAERLTKNKRGYNCSIRRVHILMND